MPSVNQPRNPADYHFDFLKSYINKILDEAGFADITQATRDEFVPQFMAEAQKRLGLALLPLLPTVAEAELMAMQKNNVNDPELVRAFWLRQVPNFDEVSGRVLAEFGEEVKNVVKQIK
jgi:hypothetical protein